MAIGLLSNLLDHSEKLSESVLMIFARRNNAVTLRTRSVDPADSAIADNFFKKSLTLQSHEQRTLLESVVDRLPEVILPEIHSKLQLVRAALPSLKSRSQKIVAGTWVTQIEKNTDEVSTSDISALLKSFEDTEKLSGDINNLLNAKRPLLERSSAKEESPKNDGEKKTSSKLFRLTLNGEREIESLLQT